MNTPDWNYWRSLAHARLWEIVALSKNADPKEIGALYRHNFRKTIEGEFFSDFQNRLTVLSNHTALSRDPRASKFRGKLYIQPYLIPEAVDYIIKTFTWDTTEQFRELATALSVSEPVIETAKVKASVGRPPIVDTKAKIIRRLIEMMLAGQAVDSSELPGNAEDLLDACKRLEKATTGKVGGFSTTSQTFKTWLSCTGYAFKLGRCPDAEANYWTNLCPQIAGKIPRDVFLSVKSESGAKALPAKA